jgi:hypothetical protein
VGTWKFEYSLSEDLGGYAAGTPVIATVTYRRDFSTGGLYGFAETLTLSGASVSNGTYFINWNDTTSMLESHGRFVAGEVVAIFDEYLDSIKGDTYCWIGQRTQDGVASPNVMIERCIRNNSFNVVVNELSASGNPLAQVWNVSGERVNMLKECLGPFVTLASEWQSESYTDAGDRIRIEHNGYWAADEACLVVEVRSTPTMRSPITPSRPSTTIPRCTAFLSPKWEPRAWSVPVTSRRPRSAMGLPAS